MLNLTEINTDKAEDEKEEFLATKLTRYCKSLCSAADLLDKRNHLSDEVIIAQERRLLKEANVIYSTCCNYLQEKGKSQLIYDFIKGEASEGLVMKADGEGYRFIFNELLPPRANITNRSVLSGYIRTVNGYKAALADIIQKYRDEYGIKFFTERVAVEITHFFADENQLKDYDNIEAKPITDTITFHFIKDDSPQYESVHFDYQKCESNPHSEIWITTENDYYSRKAHRK